MKAIAEQLGNVAPDAEAILPELVRRSADGMQWTEATAVDVPSSQESLPGFG
jgi:hypothetical protein